MRASGIFTLQVNGDPGDPTILFTVRNGVEPPARMVRIEAVMPFDLTALLVYEAFRVQNQLLASLRCRYDHGP